MEDFTQCPSFKNANFLLSEQLSCVHTADPTDPFDCSHYLLNVAQCELTRMSKRITRHRSLFYFISRVLTALPLIGQPIKGRVGGIRMIQIQNQGDQTGFKVLERKVA